MSTTATARRTMPAKYDGWCKGCNAEIAKGQMITYIRPPRRAGRAHAPSRV